MGRFRISFLLVFLLNVAIINAQQTPMTLGYVKMAVLNTPNTNSYIHLFQPKNISFSSHTDSSKIKFAPNSISSTYYTEHLGMMCKEEIKLQRIIKFPVRIRLGSKEEVDYLEGKYNHH